MIEAKSDGTRVGRKRATDALAVAIAYRHRSEPAIQSAIYVGKTEAAFAQEVGEWCEMSSTRGLLVACTFEHLVTALRFLIVQRRIQEIRDILPEVDAATILSEIGAIRTSLKKITNIKTQVNAVIEGAETIRTEAEALREEINSALTTIERAIHLVKEKEQPKKLAARAAAG